MIDILGTKYTVSIVDSQKDLTNVEHVAECDRSKLTITVAKNDIDGVEYSEIWMQDSFIYMKQVITILKMNE